MATQARRPGWLVLSLVVVCSPVSVQAQGAGAWSGCKTDALSNYNCAQYYSGTLTLSSELKGPNGTEVRSVAVTVTAGKVSCKVKQPDSPAFEGAGMLAAEHEGTGNSGKYNIKVWCPEAAGERPSRDNAPVIDTYEQRAADYAILEGKDAHDHPDADAANGVTGTETLVWQLRR